MKDCNKKERTFDLFVMSVGKGLRGLKDRGCLLQANKER